MSLHATYDGNLAEAITLACKAQDVTRAVGDQPLVMSMLHLREAFAHATLRDVPGPLGMSVNSTAVWLRTPARHR
ncbi:hypothetical protein [Streptomyces rhizosphaericus]|uniref:Uncharacterized protein n=1 Tax=Streptomyces rhizosphaericus TaxID=114699 RepID=A0ABP4AZG7_9ACTN|nr:hypothetical protein [Streptomyces cangkringensis]